MVIGTLPAEGVRRRCTLDKRSLKRPAEGESWGLSDMGVGGRVRFRSTGLREGDGGSGV